MELTFLLTVVAQNHFKAWVFISVFLLGACSEQEELNFHSTGISINDQDVFIEPIELDSILFASGASVWTLKGSIQLGSKRFPYQVVSECHPKSGKVLVLNSSAPDLFDSKVVSCICTVEGNLCKITWRTANQSIYVITNIISER